MKELTERQLGYISGILDGEGTININIRKANRKGTTLTTDATVRVATSNKRLSELLYHLLDGNKGEYKNNSYPTQFYYWSLRSPKGIGELLQALRPSIIIKRDQVELMLEWLRVRRRRKKGEQMPRIEVEIIKKLKEVNSKRGNLGKPDSFMSRALRELDTNTRKP